jgi:hypothetical protein
MYLRYAYAFLNKILGRKIYFFVGVLKVTEEKSRIRIRIRIRIKNHGCGTLVPESQNAPASDATKIVRPSKNVFTCFVKPMYTRTLQSFITI